MNNYERFTGPELVAGLATLIEKQTDRYGDEPHYIPFDPKLRLVLNEFVTRIRMNVPPQTFVVQISSLASKDPEVRQQAQDELVAMTDARTPLPEIRPGDVVVPIFVPLAAIGGSAIISEVESYVVEDILEDTRIGTHNADPGIYLRELPGILFYADCFLRVSKVVEFPNRFPPT